MTCRSLLLVLLLGLFSLAAYPQKEVEKIGQRMRVVARSPRGGYRLCKPMRGTGFCIEGSGPNEGFVLGYSPEGDLERALDNPDFRSFLQAYDTAVVQTPVCRIVPAGLRPAVEPMLTDTWNQPRPYNICAPMIGGKHCLVGCVALALSQVMRYWRWPVVGHGTHTYVDSLGCGQTLTADFRHEYRWDLIRDVYRGAIDSSDVSLLEAGRLWRDCGVAVNMRYGLSASGAKSVRQAIALHTWFGYDGGMQFYYRDFFSRREWTDMLLAELSAGRPVLFAGHSLTLAHAIVCDGYDEDGYFHFNMGMGGVADGYYYLPHLTPQMPDSFDPDRAEKGFNVLQAMTVGVRPAEANPVVRHSFGMAGIKPVVASAGRRGQVSVATAHLANLGWNLAGRDSVRLVLLRGEEHVADLAIYPHAFSLEELTDSTYTDTLSFAVSQAVDEGLYRVCPAVREPDGALTLVRAGTGTPSHVLLRVSPDSLTLTPDESQQASIELVSWQFPDSLQAGQRPPFGFTVRNNSMSEYCGRLYILLHQLGSSDVYRPLQLQGMWLDAGEQVTYLFRKTRVRLPEGDYELCLAYDCDLFTDSLIWLSTEPLKPVRVYSPVPSAVERVEAEGASAVRRYTLDGTPWTDDRQGVSVVREKGKSRKIITR